jgi:hypothetical protein
MFMLDRPDRSSLVSGKCRPSYSRQQNKSLSDGLFLCESVVDGNQLV